MDVRVPEETSVATTIAGVSIAAEASLHTSGSISLDLCSFGELKTVEEMLQVTEFGPFFICGLEGGSTASEKEMYKGSKSASLVKEEKETGLLHNRHRFYENMLVRPTSQLVLTLGARAQRGLRYLVVCVCVCVCVSVCLCVCVSVC